MEEKVESEHSYSGESSSSSESSSGSSDGEDEAMESVLVEGQTLELPRELCEDYSVFKEFFCMKTWDALEDKHKDTLKQLLPKFTENEEEEQEKTIKMLFNHEPFHFTSPLGDFYNNLRQGNYRPDIAKMRKFLMKARAKQQRHKRKSYYAKLLPEVLISRERLLAAAKAAPPGPVPLLPTLPPKPSAKNNYKPLYLRARQRYFEELAAIRSEVGGEESEDDNYPEGPPEQSMKKQKLISAGQSIDSSVAGTLGNLDPSHPTSLECLKNVLAAHRSRRQYRENHPELNTAGITLDDIKQRVALVNGAKKLMFGGQKSETPTQKLKRAPKKEPSQKQAKDPKQAAKKDLESVENKPLLPNIKIKCEQEESDSESSSFVDPVASPKLSKKIIDHVEIKQEIPDVKYPNMSNMNYNESKFDSLIKEEPQDQLTPMGNASRIHQPVPIKLEDLDGIDMMALPVELADDSGEVIPVDTSTENTEDGLLDTDASLTETTHANFLSLVRALFPARAAHRASRVQLHARCAAVLRSPIAPLNTWYSLSDDWCAELDSALDFLSGERGPHPDDFVPYLQFLPESQVYQWIGAGRDCDAILGRLCERWLRAVSPQPLSSEPPPPRYPTTWVVRPPTNAEIAEFRAQERRRFAQVAKPFAYYQHGYRAVVGPCARATVTCASQAPLMVNERPRHASFIVVLKDAIARLPNGEGTRHDVVTLLKMSQWIAPCSDHALLSAVSSALDKMHAVKRDPIVKYDQRTAVWTYLYRHRSEEDWIKSSGGRGRGHKSGSSSHGARFTQKDLAHNTPVSGMELEVASVEEVVDNASDSDVDVDDSNVPSAVPQLSSAQLLMQATQANQAKQQPATKTKGKLVATPPQKKTSSKASSKQANVAQPKQTSTTGQAAKQPATKQPNPATPVKTNANQTVKQVNLANQATKTNAAQAKQVNMTIKQTQSSPASKPNNVTKQANLMAQSAKQANVIAQLKQSVAKQNNVITKQVNMVKAQSTESLTSQAAKQTVVNQTVTSVPKSLTPTATPSKSPLIKQRPLQKTETPQTPTITTIASNQQIIPTASIIQPALTVSTAQVQNKVAQGTRSLLIRPPAVQTTVTAGSSTAPTQVANASRRGVVRVLSPATPAVGKSLISPRALMQQGSASKKRPSVPSTTSVTTTAQSTAGTSVVSSASPAPPASVVSTRTVQLAGGRTVQLAASQTVHLPGGQPVQLAAPHTLQLSSLQLPAHSVRLPSGHTVQLRPAAAPTNPRAQHSSPALKAGTAQPTVQIPVSTVQLAGQTVQIAGQTVQLGGQSVQLTGHTVKLPSGQSVQVASQGVLPTQSVQLPSGQTVQLASGNLQTVQLSGSNVISSGQSGQSVQLGSQTVQLGGQTVQLAGGQTVQLPSGQTLQLSSGQTVQLSSGQTIQLASGQTVQLATQQTPKSIGQVVRAQTPGDKPAQPIVAKLLTNAQGQMISLEGVVGGGRAVQVSGVRARGGVVGGGVRVLAPTTRLARPLLLTSAKPLHNYILQQSDGSTIRVTSSGGAAPSQTIVLSNLGAQAVTTSTSSAPVLKLQQVNPIQQVKLAQGIKIQQGVPNATVPTSSGVRGVLMDGQQLKLVGGRHVLARILRPAHPPQ